MTDLPKLPWVSVTIGSSPEQPEASTLELDFSRMTTPDCIKASRQIEYAIRTLEQWSSYLWKVTRNATDRMADQLGYDERRKGF